MNAVASIHVREMREADLQRVMEIADSLREAPKWPRGAYLAALDKGNALRRVALVAEEPESGALAGFAVASVVSPEAELETIAVAAAAQRRGVGRRLVKELVEALKLQGVGQVHLEVRATNQPALELYRSLGFVEAGRRARYYAEPVEDAILLARSVV